MTEETCKLFVAPWKTMPEDPGIVQDVNGAAVAICVSPEVANAFLRLPELYDALREAAGGKCWSCAGANVSAILNDGCPKGNDETCYVAKWIELLKKVRDGEE